MPADTNDFSKVNLADLDDWLKMAEEFGFYVIVRPGPYICAEWDTGGFPQWLMMKKPGQPLRGKAWLRSDDPGLSRLVRALVQRRLSGHRQASNHAQAARAAGRHPRAIGK